MSRIAALATVIGAASLIAAAALPGVAAADEPDDGWWYLDNYGIEDAWAKGIDGSGVTIALIDSPVDPAVPWLAGADITLFDNPLCTAEEYGTEPLSGTATNQVAAYHATGMVGFYAGNGDDGAGGRAIRGVAPGARVLVFPQAVLPKHSYGLKAVCYPRHGASEAELADLGLTRDVMTVDDVGDPALALQIERAIDEEADLIHMPFGFSGITPGSLVEAALLRAQREGVILVTGRANDPSEHLDFVSSAPGQISYFPGTLTVSSLNRDNTIASYSATVDPGVDILAPGGGLLLNHGTQEDLDAYFEVTDGGNSSASAIMTGYLALLMSKYPDATGNQILHTVISSTLDGAGEAVRDPDDTRGWGAFTFKYAGATDPTAYPDTNPIFDYDLERITTHFDNYDPEDYDPGDYADTFGPTHMADWGNPVFGYDFPREETLDAWWPNIMAYDAELHAPSPAPGPTESAQAAPETASNAFPVWVWLAAGGVVVAGAIAVLVVVLLRRRRPLDCPTHPPHQGQ